MFLKSFDNEEFEYEKNLREERQQHEKIKNDLIIAKQTAHQKGYDKGYAEANKAIQKQKDAELKDIKEENKEKITTILKKIQGSRKAQSLHYAELMQGVFTHFIPEFIQRKSLDNIGDLLNKLIEKIDHRHITLLIHPDDYMDFENISNIQIGPYIHHDIKIKQSAETVKGKIDITFEDGLAQIDLKAIKEKITNLFHNLYKNKDIDNE